MTDEVQATALPGMTVENNSAPVEQPKATETPETLPEKKEVSKEMVSTEPKTDISVFEQKEPQPKVEIKEAVKEAPKSDPDVERFIEKLKVEDLQRQLDATKPKETPFTQEPNINDKSTWGKFKDGEDNFETFLKARDAYVEQKANEKFNANLQTQKTQEKQREVLAKLQAQAAKARTKYADFDQVMQPGAAVLDRIPVVSSFIQNNPQGLEVAYELLKNPSLLAQIYQNPNLWESGQQLMKMAERISNPAPVKQSNAPEPLKPVGSREVLKPSLVKLATNVIAGYIKLQNKQELRRKRGQ